VSSPNRLDVSSPAGWAEHLVGLVYELLDAHADTDRLVCAPSTELLWQLHLDYLRDLQRTGRQILAHCVRS
jgi:hypothetical protein